MPRRRTWTDEQLRAAVRSSIKLSEVYAKLEVVAGDYDGLHRHIAVLPRSHPYASTSPTVDRPAAG